MFDRIAVRLADAGVAFAGAWFVAVSFSVIWQIGVLRDPAGGHYWPIVWNVCGIVAAILELRFKVVHQTLGVSE